LALYLHISAVIYTLNREGEEGKKEEKRIIKKVAPLEKDTWIPEKSQLTVMHHLIILLR